MKSLSLKQDLGIKLASLFLSLLLWLHVQSQASKQAEVPPFFVDVEAISVPDGLVLIDEKAQVEVRLIGPPDVVDTFQKQRRSQNLKAFVDVSSAEEGPREFRVTLEPRKDLAGLEFVGGPPTVTLSFEEKSNVHFPVEVVAGGEPPAGFEFGSATVNPPQVRLVGPKSRIERIGSVRALISLASIRPGGMVSAAVEVLDKRGNAITNQFRVIPSTVDVTPALSPAQPRRTLLVSPRYVGALPPGLQLTQVRVSPQELRVQGDRSSIANQSFLETEPIDLSQIRQTTTVSVRVKLPSGIRLESGRSGSNGQIEVRLTVAPLPSPPANPPPNS